MYKLQQGLWHIHSNFTLVTWETHSLTYEFIIESLYFQIFRAHRKCWHFFRTTWSLLGSLHNFEKKMMSMTIIITIITKMGWTDGSEVEITCCSASGPEFGSKHPCQTAYHLLHLHRQGIRCPLLIPMGTYTCLAGRHTHDKSTCEFK